MRFAKQPKQSVISEEEVLSRKPKPKIEQPFAKILTRLLMERKLTNKQAGAIAGVSPSVIQDWKTGTSPGDLTALKSLADGLGVSVSFLISGEEDKTKNINVKAVFKDGPVIFDGYAKVFIQALNQKGDDND